MGHNAAKLPTDKIFDKVKYFRYFDKSDELDGNLDFIKNKS